jgi:hypothetical protein
MREAKKDFISLEAFTASKFSGILAGLQLRQVCQVHQHFVGRPRLHNQVSHTTVYSAFLIHIPSPYKVEALAVRRFCTGISNRQITLNVTYS